jgi:transcription termination/antitermination protein NusG
MFNDFNNMPKKLTDDDDVDIKLLDVDSDVDDGDDKSVNVDDIDAGIGIVDINRGNNSKNKSDRKTISISQEGSKKGKKNKQDNKKKSGNEDVEGESSGIEKNTKVITDTDDDDLDSKFFVVRVSGGQESLIASMLQSRLSSKKIEGIYSILFLESFKGYVIVEALDSNIAYEALHGIRHIRGQIRGELPFKDLEGYLIKKPVVTELVIDDTVEIIAGPFKSMKAKIMRVDYEKQEATVVLLDSPYQIPVTVDANYLKKIL